MAEHTPGPWEHDGLRIWAERGDDRVCIASLRFQPETTVDNNDRLIAAAPMLLAVCEALVDDDYTEPFPVHSGLIMCCMCNSYAQREPDIVHHIHCPVDMAQKAIAQAKGETDALSTDS